MSHYANGTQKNRCLQRVAALEFALALAQKEIATKNVCRIADFDFFNHAILHFCKNSLMREHRAHWFTKAAHPAL
jgi:hypothetical protein